MGLRRGLHCADNRGAVSLSEAEDQEDVRRIWPARSQSRRSLWSQACASLVCANSLSRACSVMAITAVCLSLRSGEIA